MSGWRFVLENGSVVSVQFETYTAFVGSGPDVRPVGFVQARCLGVLGQGDAASAHMAIARLAADIMGSGTLVREIRRPGERTTEEQLELIRRRCLDA